MFPINERPVWEGGAERLMLKVRLCLALFQLHSGKQDSRFVLACFCGGDPHEATAAN